MNDTIKKTFRNPWIWVPTLYLFEGIPYNIINTTSGLIYKTMGISVSALAFWTSLLYIPWTFKFLWSPYVEVTFTKRKWIIFTQLLMGIAFILTGLVMQMPLFFTFSLILFAFTAFTSASHDIAADGFYMHALDPHNQTFFVGIRSTFYRIAGLTAMGLLPLVAGIIQEKTGLEPVLLKVSAVKASHFKPSDSAVFNTTAGNSQESKILLSSDEVGIPLYEKGVSGVDTTVAYIALSAPPETGEKIILNINFKSGSKDIGLAKSQTGRVEFTAENWNKPVRVTFKVDHNLKQSKSATYKITAGNIAFSWTVSFIVLGLFLLLLSLYHKFMLPYPADTKGESGVNLRVYGEVFVSFFRKPGIVPALLFFLLYRLGESQSIKVATPFLVDSRGAGGIGLTSAQYGLAYGTIGMIALTVGGILGGISAARYGLKKLFFLMALSMNLPNLGLLYIAYIQPLPGDISVYAAIILEQFGYGFGFTAYMLYMLYFVGESKFKTAEYAIGTSLMAFGMMLPGMISGYMQELLGYQHFFIYVMICTLPGMAIIPFLKVDKDFGIKRKTGSE